jgi:uncharacterized protein YndB with AHSA1/START domain
VFWNARLDALEVALRLEDLASGQGQPSSNMAIDVPGFITSVTRTLTSRDVGETAAHVLVASREYGAPVSDVWNALTTAERIPRWFLPVSGDLRPGGRYQLQGNAGGEILECDAPRRLALTWEMQGQISWVTVRLSDAGSGRTRFELEHVANVPDEFWNQFGPGAVGVGWDCARLGMDQHFTTGASLDPQSAPQWMASDEGRSFMRQSSDAWCAASIAAGTDAAAAEAAAARTTAFYTGEPVAP